MDAGTRGGDAQAIEDFNALASGPAVIEGGRNKPGLLAATLGVLAAVGAGLARVGVITTVGTVAVLGMVTAVNTLHSAYHATPPLGQGEYGGIAAEMQVAADDFLGPGKVVIFDRSAPREWEIRRVASHLNGWSKILESNLSTDYAHVTMRNQGTTCVVMGPDVQRTAERRFLNWGGKPTQLGDVNDKVVAIGTWVHEIGHCDGMNEGQADVFAYLVIAKSGMSSDYGPLLMVSRELDEYMTKGDDSHYISASLRHAHGMMQDPAFVEKVRTASWRELAEIAKSVPSLDAAPESLAKFRDALYDLGANFVVPVEEGFKVTGQWTWLKANANVPPFARIVELAEFMEAPADKRSLPKAFSPDKGATAEAISYVAAMGDPGAAKLAPLLGGKAPAKGEPAAAPRYRADEIKGELIAFDRDTATVTFGNDGKSFVIKDAASGKNIASGTLNDGVTKRFGPPAEEVAFDHHAHRHGM